MGDDYDDDDDDDDKRRKGRAPRSTFPLPQDELRLGKAKAIGRSPVTIAGGVAALASLALLPFGVGVLGAVGVAAGLGWFWKQRLPGVEREVVAGMVAERNRAQDKDLSYAVRILRRYKRFDEADRMAQFLAIKTEIERAIHASPEVRPEEVKLERMVDTLCFEVKDELFRIADLLYALKKRRKRLSDERKQAMRESIAQLEERVDHAHETLKEARRNLVGLVGVGVTSPASKRSNPVLEAAIANLREETQIAKRVRQRIEADMAAELAPWGPSGLVSAPVGVDVEREG